MQITVQVCGMGGKYNRYCIISFCMTEQETKQINRKRSASDTENQHLIFESMLAH